MSIIKIHYIFSVVPSQEASLVLSLETDVLVSSLISALLNATTGHKIEVATTVMMTANPTASAPANSAAAASREFRMDPNKMDWLLMMTLKEGRSSVNVSL